MSKQTVSNPKLPATTAQVVIVGGGIMGCALAYHLTREGIRDVILLEKAELTSGSTWHAAGQITRSTSSIGLGKCVDYNIQLYRGQLQQETGQSVGWNDCGSIRLAYSEDELDWLRYTLSVAQSLGIQIELIDADRIKKLHPFYNLDGVLGGLYTPDDGHVDPSSVTTALAKGARSRGAKIVRRCRATNIEHLTSGEWKVSTELGEIRCEHVVNAAGTYARQVGEWSGLQLPMVSMTHHYVVTDTVPAFESLEQDLPVIRDDAKVSGYIRMEQKSGLIGIYEKYNPNTVWEDGCPWEAEHELFEPDYERILPWLNNAMERMPILADLGIKRTVHGAISHPPDGNPLIGPAAAAPNYWCCCGTQIGIGWGPALTRELARWMVHGSSDISMREFDPRRFGGYASKSWQRIKGREDYCLRHEIPFPHFNRLQGRPVQPNPLYTTLREKGAVFEEVCGHERPRWYARSGVEPMDQYSFNRNVVDDIVGEEVRTVRNSVGIMDISAFTKVELSGTDAQPYVDYIFCSNAPRKVGQIALGYLLNQRGRIELELIVVRTAPERFLLICAAFYENRLLDHLNQHSTGWTIAVTNQTRDWCGLAIQGRKARQVLSRTTMNAMDNDSFSWFSAQNIEIAGHQTLALRVSYTGELGWELHMHRDAVEDIYSALWQAGQSEGMIHYGSFAMNVMRMEKAFKGAAELTNEVTLPQADVMAFVRLNKPNFIGKGATEKSVSTPLPWKCVYLVIDHNGTHIGHGGEAVYHKGEVVGSTTSIVYSHIAGCALGFAYVKPQAAQPETELQVIVAGTPTRATVKSKAVYDPTGQRTRGV